MRELADRAAESEYLQQCLDGQHGHDAFLRAQAFVTERGHGKVPQVTTLQGDEQAPLVVRVVRS